MISTFDAKTLANLKSATFVVENYSADCIHVQFAHLTGWVRLTCDGITYGDSCNLKEWALSGDRDHGGAMKWATQETLKMIKAIADKVIAEYETQAAEV